MKPLLALLLLVMGSDFAMAQAAPKPMRLFLLIGQSNMAGRGKLPTNGVVTHPRIFMLNKEMQWLPAKDPVHFDKPIAGVGLASEFARVVAAADTNATIGLIPCAMGGSSLDEWKPGSKLYNQAIERAREAKKSGQLAGILWHQGEADSAAEKVATYAERFSAMIGQLRTDLDAKTVPVIVGELGRFREASRAFNDALPAVVRNVPQCALVTAENLTDNGDKLHFDTAALELLGRRYAEAFLKIQDNR